MKKYFSRILSLSLVVMLILPLFSVNVKANNNWDNAMAVELDETVIFNSECKYYSDKQIKYYIFEPDTTGIYSINFVTLCTFPYLMTNTYVEMWIYDENMNKIWNKSFDFYSYDGPGIK